MALETLEGVKEIGGFKIIDLDAARLDKTFNKEDGSFDWNKFDEHRKSHPISITHCLNMISFRIQQGPIKENSMNGCQVDTLIEAAKIIIEGLNAKSPCRENSLAITKLEEALMWLNQRKVRREKQGIEGTSK